LLTPDANQKIPRFFFLLVVKALYKVFDRVTFFLRVHEVAIAIDFFQFFLAAPLAIFLAGL
jgi:hypothetical protein